MLESRHNLTVCEDLWDENILNFFAILFGFFKTLIIFIL